MHRLSERSFRRLNISLWVLVVFILVFTIVVLGAAGSAAYGFIDELKTSGVPGKLSYNIFVTVFTLVVVVVLAGFRLSKADWWRRFTDRWSPWHLVVPAVVLFGLWIGAVVSAFYNCSNLCAVEAAYPSSITYSGLCCDCEADGLVFQCVQPAYTNLIGVEAVEGRYQVTQAFDILTMLFLFFLIVGLVTAHYASPDRRPAVAVVEDQGLNWNHLRIRPPKKKMG